LELWLSAFLIVFFALVFDAVIGDPPNAIHPLRWMGNIVGWFDRRIKRKNPTATKIKGFLAYSLVALIFITVTITLVVLVRIHLGEWAWILVTAFLFKLSFAVFSFRKHCKPIVKDLNNGDTEAAAAKTQMIVSRKTAGMDTPHITSSCVETVSENYADSVCSPTFCFGLLGMFGAWVFRTANLMDAMWGYRNEKYGDLGFFPAKFDDVLGYVTSRISIIFISLAAFLMRMDARSAISTAMKEHTKTPSPNSGWPMTAVAGAMQISMEKKDVYVMGSGPLPSIDDVSRSYRLVELASILFLLLVTMPVYAVFGIHVQIFTEDIVYNMWERLLWFL
jgi:cobalamin biosynthesis protein CobD